MSVYGSQFTRVEQALLSPGVDFITKSSVGPFVDTGYETSFADGKTKNRVYLSISTLSEMADQAGLFDDLRGLIEEARDEGYLRGYNEGIKENFNADIDAAVERLGFVADVLSGFRADIVGSAPLEATGTGDPDGSAEVVAIEPERAKRTPGQGTGSSRQRRRADVPADSSDEPSLGI